jgi:hypothetical protein
VSCVGNGESEPVPCVTRRATAPTTTDRRLVRHAHLQIAGKLFHQPTRDLLRRPPQLELRFHHHSQPRARRQLRHLRSTSPDPAQLDQPRRPDTDAHPRCGQPPAQSSTATDANAVRSNAEIHQRRDPARSLPAHATTTATANEPPQAPPDDATSRESPRPSDDADRSPDRSTGSAAPSLAERVHAFNIGADDLGGLVRDLRGLFLEADPHDPALSRDFDLHWSPIEAQYELRTELWAPPRAASDEALAESLSSFRSWLASVVGADPTSDHR